MNISINCNISLSKKLRALMGKEGSINLIVSELKEGKGVGILSLSGDEISLENSEFKGETSIGLEPIGEIKLESGGDDISCTNIFSSVPNRGHSEKIISKIAVVNPPEKEEISTAIKTKRQVNAEASIAKTIPSASCKSWILNMEQLMDAASKAKAKLSDVDVSSARTDHEKAVLMEMKERDEAIDVSAWVVNDKVGNLSVNDLGISLPLNIPYNLGNISARRLCASRDLKVLIRDEYIRFISPEERDKFVQIASGETGGIGELEVFDNTEAAMAAITNRSPTTPFIGQDAMEVTEADINNPTEEEDAVLNLTQNAPKVRAPRENTEEITKARHTVHGNASPAPSVKPASTPLKAPPKPAFKRAF